MFRLRSSICRCTLYRVIAKQGYTVYTIQYIVSRHSYKVKNMEKVEVMIGINVQIMDCKMFVLGNANRIYSAC